MSSFFSRPGRLAADLIDTQIDDAILRPDDLYDLDGETLFRRDGRVETASLDGFEQEVV
jgi:hypothetical protein